MGVSTQFKVEKSEKIEMKEEKLKNDDLTKNQKKNLKKRLRK